ncbi:hypothetical protein CHS0354_024369, partial [Potamilus streckersoni]
MSIPGASDATKYVVAKWVDDNQVHISRFDDQYIVWRMCTKAFEKYYMDIARETTGRQYIMMACRIVKAFMSKQKKIANCTLSTFVLSYVLKNIAFYCFFSRYVSRVKDDLDSFLRFLNSCVEEEQLPQLFIRKTFSSSEFFSSCSEGTRFDLIRKVAPESLVIARRDMMLVLIFLDG